MPSASLIKEFEKLIGKENVFTSEADRQSYAYDSAVLPPVTPGLVLRPVHAEQIGMLLRRCYDEGLPMTRAAAGRWGPRKAVPQLCGERRSKGACGAFALGGSGTKRTLR